MCAPLLGLVGIASAPRGCKASQMDCLVRIPATARLTALLPNLPDGHRFAGVLLRFFLVADQPLACRPVACMRRDGRQ
jgi:hypothetical protein